MSSIIKIKRSEVSGNPEVLGTGELAYSALVDNGSNGGDRLYIGTGAETSGNAANHVVIGGKYYTGLIDAGGLGGTLNTSTNSIPVLGSAGNINQWLVGGLKLADSTLSSTYTDGDINISPIGTGKTILSNVYVGDAGTTLQEYIYSQVGGISHTADAVPPGSPKVGDTWFNTSTNTEYRYILDKGVYQWVDLSYKPVGTPMFIQPEMPVYSEGPYLWIQTGIENDGISFWFDDAIQV